MKFYNTFTIVFVVVCLCFGDATEVDSGDNVCTREECGSSLPTNMTQQTTQGFKPTFKGGSYFFPMVPIPKYRHDDPRVAERIRNQEPVIMTGRPVLKTEIPWNIEYCREKLSVSDIPWFVAISPERTFRDYNEDRNLANYKCENLAYKRVKLTFKEFMDLYKELETASNGTHAYIQSNMVHERMGDAVYRVDDALMRKMAEMYDWGEEHIHLMLLSMKDCVTPLHYDYDENLFQQVFGYKRFIFFHPRHYPDYYPYPVHHPMDRYTRANFENPDFNKYPRLSNLKGEEAVLGPGDVLYVPPFYLHLVETANDGPSFSIAFRHFPRQIDYLKTFSHTMDTTAPPQRDGKVIYNSPVEYAVSLTGERTEFQKPDSEWNLIHALRHVENLIAEVTGSYRKVPDVLKHIVDTRFEDLHFSDGEPL